MLPQTRILNWSKILNWRNAHSRAYNSTGVPIGRCVVGDIKPDTYRNQKAFKDDTITTLIDSDHGPMIAIVYFKKQEMQ